MSDQLATFLAAQQVFGERTHAVAEEQWQLPTPCTEWSVADLVGHLVDEHRWAEPLVHGHDIDAAAKVVDGARTMPVDGGVGANLAESWRTAATASADAFSADGALERSVDLSRGPTPAAEYINEMIFDLILHSWDLARATGYSEPIPDALVDEVYEWTKGYGDLSASGLFDRPVTVADDAPTIERLVALTGRDPA